MTAASATMEARRPVAAKPRTEPWLATALRMLVHAIAAAAFAWPLARFEAAIAAACGAALGSTLGPALGRTRLRTSVLVAGTVGAVGLTVAARQVVVGTPLLVPSLGPATALRVGDAVLFTLGAFSLSAGLRAFSARRRSLAVFEVAFVAVAFAQLVVAHRHGAINRPFAIADPIIAAGGDPTIAFLVLGAVAAAVVVLLLLSERSLLRALLHVMLVALVLFGIVTTTRMLGPPGPPPSGAGLGLRPEDGKGGEGQKGAQSKDRRNNDELEFRDNYDQSGARVPVGVVVLHDDYSPPAGVYYFRQGAFSQYNGRRLIAATRADVDRDIAMGFPAAPVEIDAPPFIGASRGTVEQTVALLAEHTRPFGLEAPIRLEPAANPAVGRFKRTYKAVSVPLTADYASLLGSAAGAAEWSEEQWEHYTEAPEDPRYRELAERILELKLPEHLRDDAAARALAITDWLGEQGTYSLKSRHAGAEDPTAHFLFGDLTGYCVHFAHAAAYLLRSAAVPARVATGYAVDEAARQGGSALLLSGQDSHAWPEAYLDGYGWVVFDVTPQTVLSPPPQPPDPELQRLLGELLRGENALPPDAVPELPRIARMAREFGTTVALAVGALVAALLLLSFLTKLWRRTAPAFAGPRTLPRVAYRAELDRLSEVALRRRRGESREAFASRLRAVVPSFTVLTRTHVGAAFGSRRAAEEAERLRETARAVRSELRRRVPWWRRALGLINPFGWIFAR